MTEEIVEKEEKREIEYTKEEVNEPYSFGVNKRLWRSDTKLWYEYEKKELN